MERLLDEISNNVRRIGQLGNELDNLNKSISVTGVSRSRSDLLNKKEKEIVSLIELTISKFRELTSYISADQTNTIRADTLKSDFQRTLLRFQTTQANIKRRLLAESHSADPPTDDLLGLYKTRPGTDDDGTVQSASRTEHLYTDDVVGVQDLSYTLQQEEEMHAIEEDIANVNIIFEQLSSLVYEQRAVVDSIEANIETAYDHQEQGTDQLRKAAASRQRSRKRCFICSGILVVALVITILVLILVYAPKSKG